MIEVFFDFLKSPTTENGCIKEQYENEAANWQENPSKEALYLRKYRERKRYKTVDK